MTPRSKVRVVGMLNKKGVDPDAYACFCLEVQIILALEKGWKRKDFAKMMGTSKSAISRDLDGGRINNSSLIRVMKMGRILGLGTLQFSESRPSRRGGEKI
jgi:hypothetical protein